MAILTSLPMMVVSEELERHVDQIRQRLEHYVYETGQTGVTSEVHSNHGHRPPSVDELRGQSLTNTESIYAMEQSPDQAMRQAARQWPSSHIYCIGQSDLHGGSTGFGPSAPGADVGLGQILQWLNVLTGQGILEEKAGSDHGFGQKSDSKPVEISLSLSMPDSSLHLRNSSLHMDSIKDTCIRDIDKGARNSTDKKRPLPVVFIPALRPPLPRGAMSDIETPMHTCVVTETSRSSPFTPSANPSARTQPSTYFEPGSRASFPPAHSHRRIAEHVLLPRIEIDDDPMACAILSYLDLARSMLSRGIPIQEIFGPERPIVDLLFRTRNESDAHSVCHFVCELTSGIRGMETAARLGLTFMFVHLVRWMILCSSSNYAQIPELFRPTATQINVPHSAALEFCPFPQLRDALCRRYRDFLPALASNISCNWPYGTDSCVQQLDHTGHIVLTDHFCQHVLISENWTVRSGILDTFPECRGLLKTVG
ncbi:hypothetical protein A1O1_01890 [Capronia coronata CBS 617.96]|uniref:Uncharacterized protein n=1 Tax=Capronia coronata CBS 617.96 TaxID=1182541 RepID=W9YLS1_9EURO|nr:uncharacterized protein A1O1_01890 [Capronia coronata CBS 617.96]EXJ93498.1 hypothetical protein A1O1_01890 [Capronia coronata CBS 617.96]